MTNLSSYMWLRGAPMGSAGRHHFAVKAAEIAVALIVLAALTGAWLAFFTFVPLDFTPPRVR
ncbi:MAG: hypothetical protein HW413_1590 [Thermoleophilia bacterium]|nr:hypothetical protein [Thermoleophilia bacterium]